jgi:large repetitive protein
MGQTLRVQIETDAEGAANELFLRHEGVPTGVEFDAAYEGPLRANQTVVIPSTEPGTYYLLVRGHSQPADNTPVTLFAEVLPLSIFDVTPDAGGDSRWVTTTLVGAQFHEEAIIKLVRPGIAEYEPANYKVIDSTKIIATFDLTGAPHGLYDVKVINPNGDEAVVPYRYLVERAIEPDVTIGMGGPRILSPGDTGLYGVSLKSLTNVDTPYVFFEFGLPELGINPDLATAVRRIQFEPPRCAGGSASGARSLGEPRFGGEYDGGKPRAGLRV